MNIAGRTVLVTGANRGLGKALVSVLLRADALKIYAAVRDTSTLAERDQRVVPVALDVSSDASVAEVAERCRDVDIIVNNAAFLSNQSAFRAEVTDPARLEMETNFWGPMRVIRSFAPGLAQRGTGVFVNILSVGALTGIPFCSGYCASKAAMWSMTQSLRHELKADGIDIVAVFPGPIATEMARAHEREGRALPESVASEIVRGIEARTLDIFPDQISASIAELYRADPWALGERFADAID